MAFNNDIGITDVFDKFYFQVMGEKKDGVSILEICYCIGLPLGIIVFFNHFGKKKIKNIPGKSLNSEIEAFLESVYETYGIASSEALCGYLRMSQPYLKARKNNQKIWF